MWFELKQKRFGVQDIKSMAKTADPGISYSIMQKVGDKGIVGRLGHLTPQARRLAEKAVSAALAGNLNEFRRICGFKGE